MKARNGFISNSSSSSFIIPKSALTKLQIYQIVNYIEVVKEMMEMQAKFPDTVKEDKSPERFACLDDTWDIEETEHSIRGYTSMDNFDMIGYLQEIGVPEDEINFGNE